MDVEPKEGVEAKECWDSPSTIDMDTDIQTNPTLMIGR